MLPRVSALTYTVFESRDQAGPDGSRSHPLVRLRTGPPPPAAGITHKSFSSPRPLEQMKAMVVPSGDQAGATFSTYGVASRRTAPSATLSTQSCGRTRLLTSLVSVESCTNTIARPSGDQAGAPVPKPPVLRC